MKMKYKNNKSFTILAVILITLFIFLSFIQKIYGYENIESAQYEIELKEIIPELKIEKNPFYNISSLIKNESIKEFFTKGYAIEIDDTSYIDFTLSNNNISFENIQPASSQIKKINISILPYTTGSYMIKIQKLSPLQTPNKKYIIPDTTCDKKPINCSETLAQIWTKNNAYGIGYNIQGHDIPSDFINKDYYRVLPNQFLNKPPAVIMSSLETKKIRQSYLTIKIVPPPNFPKGSYQTTINLIITPSY